MDIAACDRDPAANVQPKRSCSYPDTWATRKGYCVDAEDRDQNVGVIPLPGIYTERDCLAACKENDATGCEYKYSTSSCSYHTEPVDHGNGYNNYTCWVKGGTPGDPCFNSDCGAAVFDECGVCGGSGIPDGDCDCDGNVLDECGLCGGFGMPEGACDCDGNQRDECGVCGGSGIPENECNCYGGIEDACGDCGMNGYYCKGCMDPAAENYDSSAIIEDDSCTYAAVAGCTDPTATNYDDTATWDNDGSFCTYDGCTDSEALDACGVCGGGGLELTVATMPATCGQNNGTATVIATGGTGSYNYTLGVHTQTNGTFTNIPKGSWDLIVTGAGCVGDARRTVIIEEVGCGDASCSEPTDAGTLYQASNESECGPFNPDKILFNTLASGGSGGTPTYFWQKSTTSPSSGFSTISGVPTLEYNPPSTITQTTWYRRGYYRCDISAAIYTPTIEKTVITEPTDAGTIANPESYCGSFNPGNIWYKTLASGGSGGTPTYFWQKSTTSPSSGFSTISGVSTVATNIIHHLPLRKLLGIEEVLTVVIFQLQFTLLQLKRRLLISMYVGCKWWWCKPWWRCHSRMHRTPVPRITTLTRVPLG